MALDQPISLLPAATSVAGTDLLAVAQGSSTNKLLLSQLLTFIGANLSTGASVSFGTSIPQNTVGKNGDVFFFTNDGRIAQKISNTWSIVYTPSGSGGADGSVIYGTDVPPGNSVGRNGDTYINTFTGVFYQKSSGAWLQVYSVQTNATVTTLPILFGADQPTDILGSNSQSFINTTTREFYVKEAGSWVLKFVIPAGINGKTILNGAANPTNDIGTDGDFYVNTASKLFYGPKTAGVWNEGFSMAGLDPILLPAPWSITPTPLNAIRWYAIDGTTYLFASTIEGNTSVPTLASGGPAWTNLEIENLPINFSFSTTYSSGQLVRITFGFAQNTYRSKINGNVGHTPIEGATNEFWEFIGITKGFFPTNAPYNINDIVMSTDEYYFNGFLFKSNVDNNNYPLNGQITGSWLLLGLKSNTPLTFVNPTLPLVYEGNYSLSFNLPEGKSIASIETKAGTVTRHLSPSQATTNTANNPNTIIEGFDNNGPQTITIKLI